MRFRKGSFHSRSSAINYLNHSDDYRLMMSKLGLIFVIFQIGLTYQFATPSKDKEDGMKWEIIKKASLGSTPYEVKLSRNFGQGSVLKIKGTSAPKERNWFAVDLKCSSTGDTALHIHVRLDADTLVLNNKINSTFGPETRIKPSPFKRGSTFSLQILAQEQDYKILVNELNYFWPETMEPIDTLRISGNIKVDHIVYGASNRHAKLTSLLQNVAKPMKANNKDDVKMKLPIQTSDFRNLRENNMTFIDKSMFIKRVLQSSFRHSIITRPRRFGKSLNLSMLKYFLDLQIQDTAKLFGDLSIWNEKEVLRQHKNKYIVFHYSFADCTQKTTNLIENCIFENAVNELIGRTKQHKGLCDKITYDFILDLLKFPNHERGWPNYESAYLRFIHEIEKAGKEYVILVDEYDAPLMHEYFEDESSATRQNFFAIFSRQKFFHKVLGCVGNLLLTFFKSTHAPAYALLVGNSLVPQSSHSPALSRLKTHSVLDDERYSFDFGFTKEEVSSYSLAANSPLDLSGMKRWFGGYNIGTATVYNPSSVVLAVSKRKLAPFWSESGALDEIYYRIRCTNRYGWLQLSLLYDDVPLEKQIYKDFAQAKKATEEEIFWTLTVHFGFFTLHPSQDPTAPEGVYVLQFPNIEVKEYLREAGLIPRELTHKKDLDYLTIIDYFKSSNVSDEEFKNKLRKFEESTNLFDFHDDDDPELFARLITGVIGFLYQTHNIGHSNRYWFCNIDNATREVCDVIVSERKRNIVTNIIHIVAIRDNEKDDKNIIKEIEMQLQKSDITSIRADFKNRSVTMLKEVKRIVIPEHGGCIAPPLPRPTCSMCATYPYEGVDH